MTKKLIVLTLILLLPITIWAQGSVTFDFSESSPGDVVPTVMEKDGITLKLSTLSGKVLSPGYVRKGKSTFLKQAYSVIANGKKVF